MPRRFSGTYCSPNPVQFAREIDHVREGVEHRLPKQKEHKLVHAGEAQHNTALVFIYFDDKLLTYKNVGLSIGGSLPQPRELRPPLNS